MSPSALKLGKKKLCGHTVGTEKHISKSACMSSASSFTSAVSNLICTRQAGGRKEPGRSQIRLYMISSKGITYLLDLVYEGQILQAGRIQALLFEYSLPLLDRHLNAMQAAQNIVMPLKSPFHIDCMHQNLLETCNQWCPRSLSRASFGPLHFLAACYA